MQESRYLAGLGLHAEQTEDGGVDPVSYLHGDLVRSTMMTTDEGGAVDQRLSYTAFGEPVLSDGQGGESVGGPLPAGLGRYGYAGGWGYETGGFDPAAGLLVLQGPNTDLPPVVLQHVGARWYDGAVGRFLQRDPIGVAGGLNVYLYCRGNPLLFVDPSGLRTMDTGTTEQWIRDMKRGGMSHEEAMEELVRWHRNGIMTAGGLYGGGVLPAGTGLVIFGWDVWQRLNMGGKTGEPELDEMIDSFCLGAAISDFVKNGLFGGFKKK